MKGCSHRWQEQKKDQNFVCQICGALGGKDPVKDPLSENGMVILRPGTEDWQGMTLRERSRWYTDHQAQIVACIKAIGGKATRRKWQVPSSTYYRLCQSLRNKKSPVAVNGMHRILAAKESGAGRIPVKPVSILPGSDGEVPEFPSFNNIWTEAVQLEWLKTYAVLFGPRG